jgi:hypothetical protein
MQICVIGDSHTAALKAGWTSVAAEFPDVTLTFFAAGRERLVHLVVQDGALVAGDKHLRLAFKHSSGGADRIIPRFDRYVLCGLGSGMRTILPLFRALRPATIVPDDRQIVSNACYAACMARLLAMTPLMWLLELVRQISDAPALLVPTPSFAPRPAFDNMQQTGEAACLAALFVRAFDGLAAPHGARFLPQPRETLDRSVICTDPIHFRGAVHLSDGGDDDQNHCNAAYGAIVLRHVLAELAPGQAPPSTSSG